MVSIARTKQFILVSEEHDKTFIEQNHLLENLALNGGKFKKHSCLMTRQMLKK